MKILISTGVFYRVASLVQTEAIVREMGYDGVELNLPPRNRPDAETHRDTDYASLGHCMAVHAAGDTYDKQGFAAALTEGVTIAESTGASIVNIHPAPLSLGGRDHVLWAIGEIQRMQAQTDVTIVYEVLVDPNGIGDKRHELFVRDQAYMSVDAWVDDVNTHTLPATIDSCHVGTWHIPPAAVIPKIGANLKHVHFSDYSMQKQIEHLVPGDGDVQLKEFLHELKRSRPDIFITVELHPANTLEDAVEDAKRTISYIREVV